MVLRVLFRPAWLNQTIVSQLKNGNLVTLLKFDIYHFQWKYSGICEDCAYNHRFCFFGIHFVQGPTIMQWVQGDLDLENLKEARTEIKLICQRKWQFMQYLLKLDKIYKEKTWKHLITNKIIDLKSSNWM